jgi:hypothetical protein
MALDSASEYRPNTRRVPQRSAAAVNAVSRPYQRIDGRTRPAKRIKKLTQEFMQRLRLRADSPLAQQVRACAELQVICEAKRSELLVGMDGVKRTDALVRLEGALGRRLRALGLDQAALAQPPRPTLAERLRSEAGAEQANGRGRR